MSHQLHQEGARLPGHDKLQLARLEEEQSRREEKSGDSVRGAKPTIPDKDEPANGRTTTHYW